MVSSWDEGYDVMALSSEQSVGNSRPSYVDGASTGPWKQLMGQWP